MLTPVSPAAKKPLQGQAKDAKECKGCEGYGRQERRERGRANWSNADLFTAEPDDHNAGPLNGLPALFPETAGGGVALEGVADTGS